MLNFRKITADDDIALAKLIRDNLEALGLAIPGTAYFDPALDHLSEYYLASEDRFYYVLTEDDEVIGGAGLDRFDGIANCAELQKLYLTDAYKGRGLGQALVEHIEEKARLMGYEKLYLETHTNLTAALHLYDKMGYALIPRPESVVHSTMNRFYLKSLTGPVDFHEVYRILRDATPLDIDCGSLCHAACCRNPETDACVPGDCPEEDGDCGIYLLPGEEVMQDRNDDWLKWEEDRTADYDFPASWPETVLFVRCSGPEHCKRDRRPIQCMTFPLLPHLSEDGQLSMIISDMPLPYTCPLIRDYQSIRKEFVEACWQAWSRLIRDPRIYDLVFDDSRYRDSLGEPYIQAFRG